MTTRSNYRPWSSAYATPNIPSTCADVAALSWGHTCGTGGTGAPLTPCYPWGSPTALSSDYTFFSPGTACPSGWMYETTRTTALSVPRSAATQDQWLAGETALYCCPTGYRWSEVAAQCRFEYGGVYTNANCSNGGELSVVTMTQIGNPERPVAPALQLRFQQSDGVLVVPSQAPAETTGAGGGVSRTEVVTTTGSRSTSAVALATSAVGSGGARSVRAAVGVVVPLVLAVVLLNPM